MGADPESILTYVREFNALIRSGVIDGPNCIDRAICDGNCCFIQIDIPRALAAHYIDQGWATKDDFIRGPDFTFEIKADLEKLRCSFFDFALNGCKIHQKGMKPPQCWVYPTGLDPESAKDTCKKAAGWKILDPNKVLQAKAILEKYITLCKAEAQAENLPSEILKRMPDAIFESLKDVPPHAIAGLIDGWDTFKILPSEGYGMGMRMFCGDCAQNGNYFECKATCTEARKKLVSMLRDALPKYISQYGFKKEYSLMEMRTSK